MEALRISSVYVWQNDMVMVFDQHGQQMPEYQGHKSDVMERILKDMPKGTVINHGDWQDVQRANGWRSTF